MDVFLLLYNGHFLSTNYWYSYPFWLFFSFSVSWKFNLCRSLFLPLLNESQGYYFLKVLMMRLFHWFISQNDCQLYRGRLLIFYFNFDSFHVIVFTVLFSVFSGRALNLLTWQIMIIWVQIRRLWLLITTHISFVYLIISLFSLYIFLNVSLCIFYYVQISFFLFEEFYQEGCWFFFC